MRILKVVIIIQLLTFKFGYTQEHSDYKYQLDLSLTGGSKINTFVDASTSGLGLVYKHDLWALNGQFLYTTPIIGLQGESKGYFNLDILGGLRYEYHKIELGLFTGISYVNRRAGEIRNDIGEESKSGVGLPIKGKIDVWISKRLSIGLLNYYCANHINSIYGSSLNLGYRF